MIRANVALAAAKRSEQAATGQLFEALEQHVVDLDVFVDVD